MACFLRVLLPCAALVLLGACVGVIPIPYQAGTTTVTADDRDDDDGY